MLKTSFLPYLRLPALFLSWLDLLAPRSVLDGVCGGKILAQQRLIWRDPGFLRGGEVSFSVWGYGELPWRATGDSGYRGRCGRLMSFFSSSLVCAGVSYDRFGKHSCGLDVLSPLLTRMISMHRSIEGCLHGIDFRFWIQHMCADDTSVMYSDVAWVFVQ